MATRVGGNQQPRRNHVPVFGQWQTGNVDETVPYTAVFDRAHASRMFDENGHLIVPRASPAGDGAAETKAGEDEHKESPVHDPYAIPIPTKASRNSVTTAPVEDRDPYATPVHDPYAIPSKNFPNGGRAEEAGKVFPREQRHVAAAPPPQMGSTTAGGRRLSAGSPQESSSFRTWGTPTDRSPQQQQRTAHSPSPSPPHAARVPVKGVGPMNPAITPWSNDDSRPVRPPPPSNQQPGGRSRTPSRTSALDAEEEAEKKLAFDKWQNDIIHKMDGAGELVTEQLPAQFLPPPNFDDVLKQRTPPRASSPGPPPPPRQQRPSHDSESDRPRKAPSPSPKRNPSRDEDEANKKAAYDKWLSDSILALDKGKEITTAELPSKFLPPPNPDQFLNPQRPPPPNQAPGKAAAEGRRPSGSGTARPSDDGNSDLPRRPSHPGMAAAKVADAPPPRRPSNSTPAPRAQAQADVARMKRPQASPTHPSQPPPNRAPPQPPPRAAHRPTSPQPSGCFSCFARR